MGSEMCIRDSFVRTLAERAHETGGAPIQIDLERQLVTDGHRLSETFEVDRASRHRLLNGLDDIGLILQHEAAIARYESAVGDQWSVIGGASAIDHRSPPTDH